LISKLEKRIQSYFSEIAKRFLNTSWEISNIRNEMTKITALMLLSKYWNPEDILNAGGESASLSQLIVTLKTAYCIPCRT
jgi:hypothetical protein